MAIESLLATLEDPFDMFPLESVARQFSGLFGAREERRADRVDWYWWGVSPSSKYRSVEDEHELEVFTLLIGSAFVLAQAGITRAVSIVTRLCALAGTPSWLPQGKSNIKILEARIHAASGLSEIVLYDAVANYFKHCYEWPPNWANASKWQQPTIDAVLKLGLLPESEDNLWVALQNLGIGARNMAVMGTVIRQWRERLAGRLREQLDSQGSV